MTVLIRVILILLCGSLLFEYARQVTWDTLKLSYGYPIILSTSLLLLMPGRLGPGSVFALVGGVLRFAFRLVVSVLRAIWTVFAGMVVGLWRLAAGTVVLAWRVVAAIVGVTWRVLAASVALVFGFALDKVLYPTRGARMMSWFERLFLLNRFHGGFLMNGRTGRLNRTRSFQSCITVAGQGTGKSSACVIPNLFTLDGCSLVVTDTKGSVYAQCSGDLARRGFEVKVLNLMEPGRSHGYNPLARARTPLDVIRTVELVYRARGGQSSDPFWDDGAMRVLRILVQCLINRGEATHANLPNVKHLLDHFDGHVKGAGLLNRFIVESTVDDTRTFNDYKGLIGTTAERTLLSFVAEAATSLRLFASGEIANLMARDDFDFAGLRRRKTALFVMVRQQDMGTYNFILNMFYRDLFDELLGSLKGKLPVFMMLDEFGHMQVPGFEVYATTAREYRVAFWMFLQSLGQLRDKYGPTGAETILDGIQTRTFFGGMNLETAEHLSREIGVVRTPYRQSGANTVYRDDPLLRPEQLRGLADGDMLFLHRNLSPAVLRTTPYFKRREFAARARRKAHPLPTLETVAEYLSLDPRRPRPPESEAEPVREEEDDAAAEETESAGQPGGDGRSAGGRDDTRDQLALTLRDEPTL